MHPDTAADPSDRPYDPAADAAPLPAGAGPLRWVLSGVLLVLLVVGAWRGYQWLTADMERRRHLVTEEMGAAATPASPAPAPAAAGVAAGPVQALPNEPEPVSTHAPANSAAVVNKCVSEGSITYTNGPCPPGSEAEQNLPLLPSQSVLATVQEGRDARASACAYLSAEIARLNFEFNQPLPPPVIDHIAARLLTLRAEHENAGCAAQGSGRRRGGRAAS